jgi:hypothetical protein
MQLMLLQFQKPQSSHRLVLKLPLTSVLQIGSSAMPLRPAISLRPSRRNCRRTTLRLQWRARQPKICCQCGACLTTKFVSLGNVRTRLKM